METFRDAQHMTAAEKSLTLRQWRTFLKRLAIGDTYQLQGADYGYFPRELDAVFPDRLYKFLSLYAGFIAHYNRRGFLSARFTDEADIKSSFAQLRARTYSGGYSDMADLGAAFVKELDAQRIAFDKRWARAIVTHEKEERAELARLQAKYEAPR